MPLSDEREGGGRKKRSVMKKHTYNSLPKLLTTKEGGGRHPHTNEMRDAARKHFCLSAGKKTKKGGEKK